MEAAVNAVTGEGIWALIQASSEFKHIEGSEGKRENTRIMAMAAPALFADLLDQPVSVGTVLAAQGRMAKFAVDEPGLLERAYDSLPASTRGDLSKETFVATLRAGLEEIFPALEAAAANPKPFLADRDLTELEYLSAARGGRFEKGTMRAYLAGDLTIGGLLLLQPTAIIRLSAGG